MINRWLKRFLCPRCIACDAAEVVGLCDDCAVRLPNLGSHCPTCANSVADERYPCGTCLRRPPAFQRLLVRWRFAEVVRGIILQAKYQADRRALRVLEDEACRLLAREVLTVDAVITMPISKWRLSQRGFNQVIYPARAVAKQLGIPLIAEDRLYKQGRPPQSGLHTPAARRRNIHGAFKVRGTLPPRLIIVDDVITSGATLNEAARTLRAAGAEEITALAIAAAHYRNR